MAQRYRIVQWGPECFHAQRKAWIGWRQIQGDGQDVDPTAHHHEGGTAWTTIEGARAAISNAMNLTKYPRVVAEIPEPQFDGMARRHNLSRGNPPPRKPSSAVSAYGCALDDWPLTLKAGGLHHGSPQ